MVKRKDKKISGFHLPRLVWSILICLLAGYIGSYFTAPNIATWYAALIKPSFNPPNWIFGPVWTILYILMGIALYLVWNKGFKTHGVKQGMMLFGIQLFLNSCWSIVFFGMKMPLAAFIVIIGLWICILLTTILFNRISKPASWLMLPYILWVSFAAVLNFAIYRLNM